MANFIIPFMIASPEEKSEKKLSFWELQKIARAKSHETSARTKKIKLDDLTMFTQQLAAMLDAGLPLLTTLEALREQTTDPVFKVIIGRLHYDISSGVRLSEAVKKFPNVFPTLFVSMIEAGEASGAMASIVGKLATYFEKTGHLVKKVKTALAYPIAVIVLAVVLVNVLLMYVIPVFAEMFASFNAKLPFPTRMLITTSDFLNHYILFILLLGGGAWYLISTYFKTPAGRVFKDRIILRIPIVGQLKRKVAMARFASTYATLMRSGVPIIRSLEICSSASDNTFVEKVCSDMIKNVSQGGQISSVLAGKNSYFFPLVMHMVQAGEKTGNIEGMMEKTAVYYDVEVEKTVDTFTVLLEPFLIVFLGVVVGGIVMAMYLPIFELSGVVAGG